MPKKSNLGGARPGAGRPVTIGENSVALNIRLSLIDVEWIDYHANTLNTSRSQIVRAVVGQARANGLKIPSQS
jgi:hypothetical protein